MPAYTANPAFHRRPSCVSGPLLLTSFTVSIHILQLDADGATADLLGLGCGATAVPISATFAAEEGNDHADR